MLRTIAFLERSLFCVGYLLSCQSLCHAEYPIGAIPRESKHQDLFYAGEILPESISEIRLVRFSDSYDTLPREWNDVWKSEHVTIVEQDQIKKIIGLLKWKNTPASDIVPLKHESSPCPVFGAFVAKQRNSQEWLVLFFFAYDDYVMLRSPSGMCTDKKQVWRYLMQKYPKLLRPTNGALLVTKARAEEKNTNVRRSYYRDGSLYGEIPIEHGKYNGVAKTYFKNGQVSMTLPYHDGKLNGISKSYFDNGKLLEESTYLAGERHGFDRFYVNDKLTKTLWWWHGKNVSEDEFKRAKAGEGR